MNKSNFDKFPEVKVKGHKCFEGWDNIISLLSADLDNMHHQKKTIAIECYHGMYINEIISHLEKNFAWLSSHQCDICLKNTG